MIKDLDETVEEDLEQESSVKASYFDDVFAPKTSTAVEMSD